MDKALENGETVEYRTGMVVPDPAHDDAMRSMLAGWDVWALTSGANTTGFRVSNGRVRIKNTNMIVSAKATCSDYLSAATILLRDHKVCTSVLELINIAMLPNDVV